MEHEKTTQDLDFLFSSLKICKLYKFKLYLFLKIFIKFLYQSLKF